MTAIAVKRSAWTRRIAGAFAMGEPGPLWYALAVIAMNPLRAWAGARLAAR
jgi:hypothetical protein